MRESKEYKVHAQVLNKKTGKYELRIRSEHHDGSYTVKKRRKQHIIKNPSKGHPGKLIDHDYTEQVL